MNEHQEHSGPRPEDQRPTASAPPTQQTLRARRRRNAAHEELRKVRRDLCAESCAAFARTYLDKHFPLPPSTMHTELFADLQAMVSQRGTRLAVAAPRGHAKSTIASLAYILWTICYQKEPYILLISDSGSQASDMLSHIKVELTENTLLTSDFPEVMEPPGVGGARWRSDEIVTQSGIKVTACGTGQRVRGRRNRNERPSLIIVDDAENDAGARSEEQRRNLKEWFNRAVLKVGTPETNVVVVGTVMHADALLMTLLSGKKAGWIAKRYQAVVCWADRGDLWQEWENIYQGRTYRGTGEEGRRAAQEYFDEHREEMLEGAEVLWPERESYLDLMKLRLNDGRASFDSEKQNEPVNPDESYFFEEKMTFWDDEYPNEDALFTALGREGVFVGACDPSLGRNSKCRGADYTAIITLFYHIPSGVVYVVDGDIRRRYPHEIVSAVIGYARIRPYQAFYFETNQFQLVLADQLRAECKRAGVVLHVVDVKNTTNKVGRIQRLEPLVNSGHLRFSRRYSLLIQQLLQFPRGSHDDGPDALEMAVVAAATHGYDRQAEWRRMQQQTAAIFGRIERNLRDPVLDYGGSFPPSQITNGSAFMASRLTHLKE